MDVRPEEEFEAEHLPFAYTMPLAQLKTQLADLPKDRFVIAYCCGPFCLMSADAIRLLRQLEFDAIELKDGIAEWLV